MICHPKLSDRSCPLPERIPDAWFDADESLKAPLRSGTSPQAMNVGNAGVGVGTGVDVGIGRGVDVGRGVAVGGNGTDDAGGSATVGAGVGDGVACTMGAGGVAKITTGMIIGVGSVARGVTVTTIGVGSTVGEGVGSDGTLTTRLELPEASTTAADTNQKGCCFDTDAPLYSFCPPHECRCPLVADENALPSLRSNSAASHREDTTGRSATPFVQF